MERGYGKGIWRGGIWKGRDMGGLDNYWDILNKVVIGCDEFCGRVD